MKGEVQIACLNIQWEPKTNTSEKCSYFENIVLLLTFFVETREFSDSEEGYQRKQKNFTRQRHGKVGWKQMYPAGARFQKLNRYT